jgi:hypothetical protein
MSAALRPNSRRVRNNALLLGAVAVGFYFGIIVLLFFRSHH